LAGSLAGGLLAGALLGAMPPLGALRGAEELELEPLMPEELVEPLMPEELEVVEDEPVVVRVSLTFSKFGAWVS